MKRVRKLLLALVVLSMSQLAFAPEAVFAAKVIPAIQPGEALQHVKSLAWNAVLKKNVKTKYGRYKAGKKVVVIKGGVNCIIQLGKHNYRINRKYLLFTTDRASIMTEGDYNTSTKIHFANSKKRNSKTQYLIWVSLDKQRVNVYKGSDRRWNLIRVMECSTGRANSTPIGNRTIRSKKKFFEYYMYFLEYGGSGFHKWPGPGMAKRIGKGTASSGCIRMRKKDAGWMYQNIPVGTKVVFY